MNERFWSKVDKNGPLPSDPELGPCWIWTAGKTAGYGHFRPYGKYRPPVLAHRRSYELLVGPIPAGMLVCHRCDNPPCVNPDHLFVGTVTDNNRDMARKNRVHRAAGVLNGRAKLAPADVLEIRRLYVRCHPQFGARALAARYGVSDVSISNAVRGRTFTGDFEQLTGGTP